MAVRPKKATKLTYVTTRKTKGSAWRASTEEKFPSSKELSELTATIRSLEKTIRKMAAKPVRKNTGTQPGKKNRGAKLKSKGCSVRGCIKPHCAKGLCSTHYSMEWKKHKLSASKDTGKPGNRGRKPKILTVKVKPAAKRALKTCSIEGCNNPVLAKALCSKHYWAKKYIEKKKAKK